MKWQASWLNSKLTKEQFDDRESLQTIVNGWNKLTNYEFKSNWKKVDEIPICQNKQMVRSIFDQRVNFQMNSWQKFKLMKNESSTRLMRWTVEKEQIGAINSWQNKFFIEMNSRQKASWWKSTMKNDFTSINVIKSWLK